MAKRKGIKAWLITWEHAPNRSPGRIAAVLDPRLTDGTIQRYVEVIFAAGQRVEDQISFVRRRTMPYGATQNRGVIQCGQNPFVCARLVDNLRMEMDDNGNFAPMWDERPPRRRWELTIDAGDRQVRRDSSLDPQSGREKIAALWDVWELRQTLIFRDIDNDSDPVDYAVRIEEIAETTTRPSNAARWGESRVELTLAEV